MELTTIKRHSLVEEVSEQLVRAIRNGLMGPTGLLPSERHLAIQFGVSRPVIREATKRLELQGLVEVRQGSGIRVVDRLHAPVSEAAKLLLPDVRERLRQCVEVRATIEPEIARRAAERATPEDLASLRTVHERLESSNSLEGAMDADVAFHRELARISGNEIFGLMLDSIAEIGRESRRATLTQTGVARALTDHRAILQAVEQANGQAAKSAMRRHIQGATEDLHAYLQSHSSDS